MIVYFANRELVILGHASTDLPKGLRINRDKYVDSVKSGAKTFSFYAHYKDDERANAEDMTAVGNYIFRQKDGEARLFSIVESELYTGDGTIFVYAEDSGLDLLGEIAEAFTAPSVQSIEWYMNKYLVGSGFTVGINEISTLTRKLAWDGESTVTERLLSIANSFGAEIDFSFEIEGMSVAAQHVNIYKKRGQDIGTELRLGRDISNITIKKSIANIATALKPTGAIPSGKKVPIDLKNYTYDDGDFYVETSSGILKSRTALEQWKRSLATGDGHIVKTYTYQTTSQSELLNRAISQLKQYRDPELNYDITIVKMPENIACGDTVRIVDDQGELYLSARILQLETSDADDTNKATLGDYLMLSSGISENMIALSKKVAELAENGVGVDAVQVKITSSSGLIAHNEAINTVLTAHVFRGGEELTAAEIGELGVIRWYNGSTVVGTGLTYNLSTAATSVTIRAKLEDA